MQKIWICLRYCIILYYIGVLGGCKNHLTDQVSDTSLGSEINKVPVEQVTPVIGNVDTAVVLSVSVPGQPNNSADSAIAPDTVEKVIIITHPSGDLLADAVRAVYRAQIGVREKTGKNDGPQVEEYLASTGLGKGNPWCAAFVRWCLLKGGVPNNITAYSPTTFNKKNLVWFKNKWIKEPRHGDVFSLYFPSMKRIAHTGFFDHKINSSFFETVEGNTNDALSRDGDGVYAKIRSFNATYSISRFINDP